MLLIVAAWSCPRLPLTASCTSQRFVTNLESLNLVHHCQFKEKRSASQVQASGHSGSCRSESLPGSPSPARSPLRRCPPPLLPLSHESEKTHLSGPLFGSCPQARHRPTSPQRVPAQDQALGTPQKRLLESSPCPSRRLCASQFPVRVGDDGFSTLTSLPNTPRGEG